MTKTIVELLAFYVVYCVTALGIGMRLDVNGMFLFSFAFGLAVYSISAGLILLMGREIFRGDSMGYLDLSSKAMRWFASILSFSKFFFMGGLIWWGVASLEIDPLVLSIGAAVVLTETVNDI